MRAVLSMLGAICLVACGDAEELGADSESAACEAPPPTALTLFEFQFFEYALAWDETTSAQLATGDGGVLDLDLESSGIGNLDVQLVPCPDAARAHDPSDDVSWIDLSFFEGLAEDGGVVGQGRSGGEAYCSALYVLGSLDEDRPAVQLSGSHRTAAGSETPLDVRGTLPAGSDRPLEFAGYAPGAARVTLVRSLPAAVALLGQRDTFVTDIEKSDGKSKAAQSSATTDV
ncbi:MAG: hypothetical protein AAF658_01325, partial [Myxococcota bacterium]